MFIFSEGKLDLHLHTCVFIHYIHNSYSQTCIKKTLSGPSPSLYAYMMFVLLTQLQDHIAYQVEQVQNE